MEFDVTFLNKTLLLQTLFVHSSPISLGQAEYNFRKGKGENVDGLSSFECELILHEHNKMEVGSINVLDYYKGKPIKLSLEKKSSGRVLVCSESYDARNGKYRFFEALLNVFTLDEIYILKKGYSNYSLDCLPANLKRFKQQEMLFKKILKNTFIKENIYGKYWAIDEKEVQYLPSFML